MHGRLVALDLLTCLAEWSDGPVEVFQDVDSLLTLENPVNLNMHHHEELTGRTPEELAVYNSNMKLPFPQRADNMRGWYGSCIEHKEKELVPQGHSVQNLVRKNLGSWISAAERSMYFGGGSLDILQICRELGVANRMECFMQAVCLHPRIQDISKLAALTAYHCIGRF